LFFLIPGSPHQKISQNYPKIHHTNEKSHHFSIFSYDVPFDPYLPYANPAQISRISYSKVALPLSRWGTQQEMG
jgi:hypothetical protein